MISTLGHYLNAYIEKECWEAQEERIVRLSQRKGHLFLTDIPEGADTFQLLALIQHHSAPTGLLDFTWSLYVAAFFALEHTMTQEAVWALNPQRLVNGTDAWNSFLEHQDVSGIGEPFIMNTRLVAQSGDVRRHKAAGTATEDIC